MTASIAEDVDNVLAVDEKPTDGTGDSNDDQEGQDDGTDACDIADYDDTRTKRGLAIYERRVHGGSDDERRDDGENDRNSDSDDQGEDRGESNGSSEAETDRERSNPFLNAAANRRAAAGDECDPSTEVVDDANAESEARDVDLAEADADDAPAPDGSGDVGNDDTVEARAAVDLPDGVTAADVYAAVDDHETPGDVAADLGASRGQARAITVALDCYSDVKDHPRGGER